jgi:hypothetical protein
MQGVSPAAAEPIFPRGQALLETSTGYQPIPWKVSRSRMPSLLLSSSGGFNSVGSSCKKADVRLWSRRDDFSEDDSFPGDQGFGRAALVLEANPLERFGIHTVVLDSVSGYLRSCVEFRRCQEAQQQGGAVQGRAGAPVAEPNLRAVVTVPADITTDPRVVSCLIFFAYTGLLIDIHGREFSSVKADELKAPNLQFDAMDLYMLADFLQVTDLADLLVSNLVNPVHVFAQCCTSEAMATTVDMMGSMLARCETSGCNVAMREALVKTYAKGAGGLLCLCKHPLLYGRDTWDTLMAAAADTSILWAAHVLPLYAVRFDLSPAEALRRFFALRLGDWVDGSRKSCTMSQILRSFRSGCFDDEMRAGTTFMALGRLVPDMRCISTIYMTVHGIALDRAYHNPDRSFMNWFISLTHIVCCALQLLCWSREPKNAAAVPPWFQAQLVDLFATNYVTAPDIIDDPLEWRESVWLPKFGLNLFLPDEWQPSILTIGIDVQSRALYGASSSGAMSPAVCESFMHTISGALAQTLCAREHNMQVGPVFSG